MLGVPLKAAQLLAAVHFPQPQGFIIASREGVAAVRGETDGGYPVVCPSNAPQLLPLSTSHSRRVLSTPREDVAAVRGKTDGAYTA